MSKIRWYNRLAAWLYEVISDPLLDLSGPVWQAQAAEDAEEQYQEDFFGSVVDEIEREAYNEGYRDAETDFYDPRPW